MAEEKGKKMLGQKNNAARRDSVFYIRGVPQDLKVDFKVYCARNNLSMTESIIELIRKVIRGEVQL